MRVRIFQRSNRHVDKHPKREHSSARDVRVAATVPLGHEYSCYFSSTERPFLADHASPKGFAANESRNSAAHVSFKSLASVRWRQRASRCKILEHSFWGPVPCDAELPIIPAFRLEHGELECSYSGSQGVGIVGETRQKILHRVLDEG